MLPLEGSWHLVSRAGIAGIESFVAVHRRQSQEDLATAPRVTHRESESTKMFLKGEACAPVTLAMRLMSFLSTRRTPMTPAWYSATWQSEIDEAKLQRHAFLLRLLLGLPFWLTLLACPFGLPFWLTLCIPSSPGKRSVTMASQHKSRIEEPKDLSRHDPANPTTGVLLHPLVSIIEMRNLELWRSLLHVSIVKLVALLFPFLNFSLRLAKRSRRRSRISRRSAPAPAPPLTTRDEKNRAKKLCDDPPRNLSKHLERKLPQKQGASLRC